MDGTMLSDFSILFNAEVAGVCPCEVFGEECIRRLSEFGDEELRILSIRCLNTILMTHCLSESVRFSTGLEIPLSSLFSFMEHLPIMDIFFDSELVAKLGKTSLLPLEKFFGDFLTHLVSVPRSEKTEILLAQLCLLSWSECFALPSQQWLAEIISNVLASQISSAPLNWPFMSENFICVSSEICSWEIVFVSVLRLVDKALCSLSLTGNLFSSISNFNPQPTSHDLNDLNLIYELSFGKLSEPNDEGQMMKTTDFELFLMGAFSFIHQSCRVCGKFSLKHPHLSNFVPQFRDRTLLLRMNLANNLYLARACRLLPRLPEFGNQFPSMWNRRLTVRDLACLQRFLVPHLANLEWCHADLMAWAIDRGIFVKDFALVFLKNATFDDALCAAKVLPRLLRQVSKLIEDSDVSLALVRKLDNLRRRNLPTNHHEDLLKELVSLLPPEVKADILARLHEKPDECSTPLAPEDSKFRCYLRKFFNRLAAGPGLSDLKPISTLEKPWRDPRAANTVSKEFLIDADLLLLTRPIDFLVELVRFPIIQNSTALFPVIYKILSHVNYSLGVHINGSGTSVLRQLMVELLALFETETPEGEETEGFWRGESHQRIALMRYLPRSGDLGPVKVSPSAQIALFATSTFVTTGDDDSKDATISTHGLQRLWVHSFVCLLDQAASWSQLMDLVDEEVLTVRAHAEAVVQSLALLLLPRVPAGLPLGFFAVPCASLLERLRTPLLVRICIALLTAPISYADPDADTVLCPLAKRLRAVLSDPEDRERRLLRQCADFLPSDLLGTVVITLPRCLIRSKLIDVAALNESAKNRFQFIIKSPQTDDPFDCFVKPLSSCDLEEVLQLVSLCDGAWYAIVNFILTSSQAPEVRSLWNCISVPTLLLALYTFLHRIAPLDELDAADRWARAIGFVDQLAAGNLITFPFTLRSTALSSPSASPPQDIFLGYYRGSLDLFDLTFALFRVIDCSTDKAPVPRLHLSRVCQTLAVLGQRLVARLIAPRDTDASAHTEEDRVDTLVEQAILLIGEIEAYLKHRDAPPHSPLKRLSASLEIVAKSLTRQRQQREAEQGKESYF
ncbi:rhoptry protein [Echinococcus multilocularis]|uniref:Rhoptry protein n=1 Tax=Echinococcus multilocularis TaxID=6211 RepID=A0A068YKQ6_ECHMU|nr:rhoptry protein [Echinococcus multilocularis]